MNEMTPRSDPRSSMTSRRGLLRTAAALGAAGGLSPAVLLADDAKQTAAGKGRLRQSACRWCYGKIGLDELCSAAKNLGLVGLDLMGAKDFPTLKKYGLVCTMTSAGSLANGLCDEKFHKASIESTIEGIEVTSKEGWRNVICFSGNARGIDRKVGMDNCVKALKEIVPVAEKANVIVQMELLNSKVDHADYMCDNSPWGVELVKRVGSDNFRLLYDIYHMQIMEGDVIRTIERDHECFGHYHTGGNPGRNEIDESQELNYKAIARAIADVKHPGFIAHEFIPKRDPLKSLAEAVVICEV